LPSRRGAPKTGRLQVNPSAPQPKDWGLLRVDPERRLFTPPSKAGLGAVERVNIPFNSHFHRLRKQESKTRMRKEKSWIPAFAGMTK